MDRLQLMSVFVAVAEEGGFAAGARRLRMSPPAVTRAVAAWLLRIQPRLWVTTNDAAIEAALRGFGIARLLSTIQTRELFVRRP